MLDVDAGVVRLRDAMRGPPPREEGPPNNDPTLRAVCIHEAGHSVATVLAGRRLKDIVVIPPRQGRTAGGQSRPHFDMVPGTSLTHQYALRNLVEKYAGPVAELRFNQSFQFDGCGDDFASNEFFAGILHEMLVNRNLDGNLILQRVKSVGQARLENRQLFLAAAWEEACRMFLDDRVWAVTQKTADYLARRAPAERLRVEGSKVHRWVRDSLPSGWDWQGGFAYYPAEALAEQELRPLAHQIHTLVEQVRPKIGHLDPGP